MTPLRIAALTRDHEVGRFDSGAPELDDWLRRFALVAALGEQRNEKSR